LTSLERFSYKHELTHGGKKEATSIGTSQNKQFDWHKTTKYPTSNMDKGCLDNL